MTDAGPHRRPDPDALLALTASDGRGRLKVFLGAAPGVGKTYAMLQGARRLAAEGVDVVIGIVETHGRADTAALVEGLEVLPRRRHDHRGRALDEFDIDAALARRPALLVVDELAHSNAPDCRHPKRWQDVEELLGAGIPVWTALNIQHLESLADLVSRITGVVVRETVPDTILQTASDVVLVDITPGELIERLQAGKVYLPETAQRATQNFFTIGNLTALRELALRRTAARVDDQMVDYLRQRAIEGPWGTAERLVVCVGADPGSDVLVRKAARLATALNATWAVVHLTRPGRDDDAPEAARRVAELLKLAASLGGEVIERDSADFTADILALARRENATQIFVGRSRPRWWGRSLSDQLVARAVDIGVHVVATGDTAPGRAARPPWLRRDGLGRDAGAAAAAVAAAIAVGAGLSLVLDLPNLSMVFLAAVLVCAVVLGTRSAVIAAWGSFLGYNFFFIEPVYTFTVAKPHELIALISFLAVAILTGSLTGRVRNQARQAMQRSAATQSLYDFSRTLAAAAKVEEVLWATVSHAHKMLGGTTIVLMPGDAGLVAQAAWPPDEIKGEGEAGAARWAYEKAEAAGWRTGTLPNVRFRFLPLSTPARVIGVVGHEPADPALPLTAAQQRTLTAITEQAAIALDRAILVGEAVRAAAALENEKIRDALLASLSHDLRTPLAAIVGAVSTLRDLGRAVPPDEADGLLASIAQESARLTRFVTNLLEMSRIDQGAITVRRDWVDVADTIRIAVERCQKLHSGPPARISLAPDLPFVRGDQHLLEQVLFNLLDNAHKYGGAGGVSVHARPEGADVVISVTDEGPGVKPGELERIFEKFYRSGGADGRKPGTGLGLSICRGLVEAMGGTIRAESPAIRRRGTRLVVRLPGAVP